MSATRDNIVKLRDLPDAELLQALDRVRDELFRLKLGMQTNQVASTASVGAKRREVAQILTIVRGRELGLEQQARPAAPEKAAKPAKKKKTRKTEDAE